MITHLIARIKKNERINYAIVDELWRNSRKGSSEQKEIRLISRQFHALLRDYLKGLIDLSEYEQRQANITKDLLLILEGSIDKKDRDIWWPPVIGHNPSLEGLESVDELESLEDDSVQRVVNAGFAPENTPQFPSLKEASLAVGTNYFFWLEVGKLLAESIAVRPASLPTEHLPEEAELEVALYAIGKGFEVDEAASVGKLQLHKDHTVSAFQQPQNTFQLNVPADMAKQRLFFPVRTGAQTGTGLLKCNIYCQGILVQSYNVRVEIRAGSQPVDRAQAFELQYSLSSTLTAKQLNAYREHKLSVLLNEDDGESHSLQIFGSKQYKKDASLGEGVISDALKAIRGAMRKAAWGTEEEYDAGKNTYRYKDRAEETARLATDLFRLAKRGHQFYDSLISTFAGPGRPARKALEELMREPSYVQLVLQKGARQILPLAAFYDRPLHTGVDSEATYRLCDHFLSALKQKQPLTECSCFQGNCPTLNDPDVRNIVCPGGFWGFRHNLGMPHSMKDSPFAPAEIFYKDKPECLAATWMGSDFIKREAHVKSLQANPETNWKSADSLDEAITSMHRKNLSLVYFYCHGGMSGTFPYLQVGKEGEPLLTPSLIYDYDIYWEDSHPLVFINGCHTTSLAPEQTLNFVTTFVENASCAGVIGTEITIFEPLAVDYFNSFFKWFYTEKKTVGEAVRNARLDILQQCNPLGLVYIPFVISGLQMVGE